MFAHRCRDDHRFTLAVHNLGDSELEVTLDLGKEDRGHLLDLFGDCNYERWDGSTPTLRLQAFGYRWFRRTAYSHEERSG